MNPVADALFPAKASCLPVEPGGETGRREPAGYMAATNLSHGTNYGDTVVTVNFDCLTERQREVYEFIRDQIRARGYGPTVREIGEEFKINSPNGVMCHLKALEKKGLITREANMSRAITLAHEPVERRGLPLAGRIAAGNLSLAEEQDEMIDFGELFDSDDHFVLEVKGDSMIEDQICDGDYVVVRRRNTASRGQVVVAMTDENEATLKRWYPEGKRIRLQPANSSMAPIYVTSAKVLGVVVGVVRKVD